MDEKEIVEKLRILSEIKPRKEWVKETQIKIVGQRHFWFSFPNFVPLAILILLFVFLSFFGLFNLPKNNQNLEKTVVQVAENDIYDYNYYLEKASQNLKKIQSIDEQEKVFTLNQTKEVLKKAIEKLPQKPKGPQETEKIVEKVKEIEKTLTTLGEEAKELEPDTYQLKSKTKEIIENEILRLEVEKELAFLETRSLTPEQKELLEEAKKDYNNQNYSSALEKLLILSNQ